MDSSHISGASEANVYNPEAQTVRKRHIRELVRHITDTKPQTTASVAEDTKRVTASQSTVSTAKPAYKPLFKWEKKGDASFHINASEKSTVFNDMPPSQKTPSLLAIFGYTITISDQVDRFKQRMQSAFIESKSHNPLTSKFSALKFSVLSSLLSLLGVSPHEIDALKKEALKTAIQNNINNFCQNEYNIELLTIFKKDKKDTSRMKVLTKLRDQLKQHMARLGQPDFYTTDRLCDIKRDQIQSIQADLLDEMQNLKFIRNFR